MRKRSGKKLWYTGLALSLIAAGVLGLGEAGRAAVPHGLSEAQLKQIRATGVKVVLPGYVPAGFRLVKLESDKALDPDNDVYPYYSLTYQGPKNQEFYLCGGTTCSWGADETGANQRQNVAQPLFSSLVLMRFGPDDPVRSRYTTAHNMVLKGGGNYEFDSPSPLSDTGTRTRLSAAEALKILKGLKRL